MLYFKTYYLAGTNIVWYKMDAPRTFNNNWWLLFPQRVRSSNRFIFLLFYMYLSSTYIKPFKNEQHWFYSKALENFRYLVPYLHSYMQNDLQCLINKKNNSWRHFEQDRASLSAFSCITYNNTHIDNSTAGISNHLQ